MINFFQESQNESVTSGYLLSEVSTKLAQLFRDQNQELAQQNFNLSTSLHEQSLEMIIETAIKTSQILTMFFSNAL
jgi:hypothetical protein